MCSTSNSAKQKPFPELKELDSLLRCGICYEYMKNALITSCSHNYCSYCIRKFMQYKSQCPTCFKETSEPQLRNNRLVDQLIALFVKMSDKIEDLLAERSWCYVDTNKPSNNDGNISHKTIESEGMSVVVDHSESPSVSSPKVKILVPDMFTPRRKYKRRCPLINEEPVNFLACPVCSVDIPERNINLHLDACLAKSNKEAPGSSPQISQRKPLPKLVYPLLQEKDLRRKLKELGLSTLGDRKALTSRHQRFTVLYNSECDSLDPRPVSDILEQVAQEEKFEKKVVPIGNALTTTKTWLSVDKKTDTKAIEQAQKIYLKENESSFAALVERAKSQGRRSPAPQSTTVSSNTSTSETFKQVEKNSSISPQHASEESPNAETSNSPEICSIPGNEPNTASDDLHSSFDLFRMSPILHRPGNFKPIDLVDDNPGGGSRPLSPSSTLRVACPSTAAPLEVSPPSTPGPSGSVMPLPTSPTYSPYRPFSPNMCVKPLTDSERTPSPPFGRRSTRSPLVVFSPTKPPPSSKSPEPLVTLDDRGDWLEVILEEGEHPCSLPKRRKRSLDVPRASAETRGGRVLRKRQRK